MRTKTSEPKTWSIEEVAAPPYTPTHLQFGQKPRYFRIDHHPRRSAYVRAVFDVSGKFKEATVHDASGLAYSLDAPFGGELLAAWKAWWEKQEAAKQQKAAG